MRVKEIKIEGLFDMFDHTLSLKMEERLSIVYGINGIGKTMVFKILDSLFNLNLSNAMALSKAPFLKLIIAYQDGSFLTLLNKPKKLEIYFEKNTIAEPYIISIEDIFNEESPTFEQISRIISRNIPALSQISGNRYRVRNTNDIIEIHEAFERYAEIFPSSLLNISVPQSLKDILSKTELFFIQTQRLIVFQPKLNHRSETEISFEKENSVSLYSMEIANIIKTKIKERDKLSNDLQQSLHKRILSDNVQTDYTIKELNEISSTIEKRIEELKAVGLFEGIQMDNFKVTEDVDAVKRAILSVNIQDIQKTLAIFDDLYPKFQKFIEILNERRLSFKKIMLSENGFVFTNSKGKTLIANDLSSGEQHELVLLYLLLFKIPENSLVLIDEPEISLHIVWQKAFLDDMKDIIKLRNFDIVVATHSPAIINGNWDLTIKLDDNGENE